MSTEADVPWLLEDAKGDAISVRMIGDVDDKPPHEVRNLRAIREDDGKAMAIPRALRGEAEEDVRATAIDLWRVR